MRASIVIVIGLAAAGLAAFYAPRGDSAPKVTRLSMPPIGPRRPALIAPALRAHFKVLSAQSPSVAISDAVNRESAQQLNMLPMLLAGMVGPQAPPVMAGASTGNVAQVPVTPTDAAVIAPGPAGMCMGMLKTGQGSMFGSQCASVSAADNRGIATVGYDSAGGSSVMGLVPNGNATVTVQTTGGGEAVVPVHANVFYYTSSSPITNVAFVNAAGASTTMFRPAP